MEAEPEKVLEELHRSADFRECMTRLLAFYGSELHGFLRSRANDGDVAESYSAVSVALVEGLPRFERRSSFRTWMYRVARFTLSNERRAKGHAHVRLSEISDLGQLAQRRSSLPSHLGEAAQSRLEALRAELSAEDRELLYLRVDRDLSWRAVAEALALGANSEPDLARDTIALRKRFERLKLRIREVIEQGAAPRALSKRRM